MDHQKDNETQPVAQEIDTLSNRIHDPIPLSKRPRYQRCQLPDGNWMMITIFPLDWWAGLAPRPKATGRQAKLEMTPIRPVPHPDQCDKAQIGRASCRERV